MNASDSIAKTADALEVPAEVIQAIRAMRRPIVVAHVVPDADALGSMFAMAIGFDHDACSPMVALPSGSLSSRLKFMHKCAHVAVASPDDFAKADGFITVDTAKKGRCNVGRELKETDWCAGRPIINIDHHATNTRFGDVNWIVDRASSTCEMVYYLLTAAEKTITPTVASLLYAGIQTDTLGFSLPTVTASSLTAAARLVERGADPGDLGERLCRSQSLNEFNLLRVIYANTKSVAGGQLIYSSASHDEIRGAGCNAADIDDQINVPRSLTGGRLAILFSEGNKGKTRMNFRASGKLTVIELAAQFNGGGHSQAAGAVLDCGIEEAMQRVLPKAEEHLRSFPE